MATAKKNKPNRDEFDAYMAACPSRQLLDRLSNKWVVLSMSALADGALRYTEISRQLAGVSQKMLTQTLRHLERDGLVDRTVTPSVPVRVDYELTDLGRSLLEPIQQLKQWAETHMNQVDTARVRYDKVNA